MDNVKEKLMKSPRLLTSSDGNVSPPKDGKSPMRMLFRKNRSVSLCVHSNNNNNNTDNTLSTNSNTTTSIPINEPDKKNKKKPKHKKPEKEDLSNEEYESSIESEEKNLIKRDFKKTLPTINITKAESPPDDAYSSYIEQQKYLQQQQQQIEYQMQQMQQQPPQQQEQQYYDHNYQYQITLLCNRVMTLESKVFRLEKAQKDYNESMIKIGKEEEEDCLNKCLLF